MSIRPRSRSGFATLSASTAIYFPRLRQTFLKSDLHARLHPPGEADLRPQPPQQPAPNCRRSPAKDSLSAPVLAPAWGGSTWPAVPTTGKRLRAGSRRVEKSRESLTRSASPSPPPWAQSLPLAFAVGPGGSFDEFSANATPAETAISTPNRTAYPWIPTI